MARIGELLGPNQEVIHPQTSASVVYLEDGRSVEQVLSDDIDYGNVVFQESSYKFSSDVEDDFAKTVIIKGQTYQNILPEPSTHVLTNDKEMFKVNEGLDPNVEVVDGVSKSAILKGQTLVNLAGEKREYINNGAKLYGWEFMLPYNLTSGKTYLAIFNTTGTIDTKNAKVYLMDNGFNGNSGNNDYVVSFKNGHNRVKCIASNNNHRVLRIRTTIQETNNFKVSDVMLMEYQEGMENWDIPYFTGMQSVKMPVVTTTGKNLSPINSFTGIVKTVNDSVVGIDKLIKKNIVLNPNKTYICSTKCSNNAIVNNMKVLLTNIELPDNDIEGSSSHNSIYTWTVNNGGKQGSINTPLTGYKYAHITTGGSFSNQYATSGDLIEYYDIQLEENSVATTYEPHKTNILSTPEEVVLRSLPNGICDILNLNTKEYVARIGEIVLDGSEDGWSANTTKEKTQVFQLEAVDNMITSVNGGNNYNLYCDKLEVGSGADKQLVSFSNNSIYIALLKENASTVEELKKYLQQNPITVQYEFKTPIVKTIDLSSSGNWEKVVLDGGENWRWDFNDNQYFQTYIPRGEGNKFNNSVPGRDGGSSFHDANPNHYTGFAVGNNYGFTVKIVKSEFPHDLSSSSGDVNLNVWKQYLSQNPITVWYQITTYQDSTQVKQPIFFKDGHIVQSSGAGNSLIPTLDYQAKTSNSYVMDLMKASTIYTMKASRVNGYAKIGNSGDFSLSVNRTFGVTPQDLEGGKLLIIKGSATDLMILEGDMTDKTIPYFKGIKSAFEDESKIEVLSCGKNLYTGTNMTAWQRNEITTIVEPNKTYTISADVETEVEGRLRVDIKVGNDSIKYYTTPHVLGTTKRVSTTFTVPSDAKEVFIVAQNFDSVSAVNCSNIQIEEALASTSYEPCKSNSTKIPLLSPLRSLPNGVCDEVIIDRVKNKATMIQRIGEIVFDGKQKWLLWDNNPADVVSGYIYYDPNSMGHQPKSFGYTINDKLPNNTGGHIATVEGARYTNYYTSSIHKDRLGAINVNDTTANSPMFQKWYTENPMTMYYELDTPVVTEIDLESFPFIYREGHIFLNGEIAPTVGIEYGINQGHRIEGQVETLQRHEQQFTKLERYFADLVHSDYNFALLRFSEKLRQQEGDV